MDSITILSIRQRLNAIRNAVRAAYRRRWPVSGDVWVGHGERVEVRRVRESGVQLLLIVGNEVSGMWTSYAEFRRNPRGMTLLPQEAQ